MLPFIQSLLRPEISAPRFVSIHLCMLKILEYIAGMVVALGDENVFRAMVGLEAALAVVTVLAVLTITAPYGRHTRPGFGITIQCTLGWIVMECPSTLLFVPIFFSGQLAYELRSLAFLTVWLTHYCHRTYIYPVIAYGFKKDKQMPITVVLAGFVFNILNAFIMARSMSEYNHGVQTSDSLRLALLIIGFGIFFSGMYLNMDSDYYLLSLKRQNKGYQIPNQGMFRLVTSPNYFGEIVEWIGLTIAMQSISAAVFALYTASNLGPRALSHHQWYKVKFDSYPRNRKALIPYIL